MWLMERQVALDPPLVAQGLQPVLWYADSRPLALLVIVAIHERGVAMLLLYLENHLRPFSPLSKG